MRGKFESFLFAEFFIYFLRFFAYGKWCFTFLHIYGDMRYQNMIIVTSRPSIWYCLIHFRSSLFWSRSTTVIQESISFLKVSNYGPSAPKQKRYGLVMVYHSVCLLCFFYLAIIIFQEIWVHIHLLT